MADGHRQESEERKATRIRSFWRGSGRPDAGGHERRAVERMRCGGVGQDVTAGVGWVICGGGRTGGGRRRIDGARGQGGAPEG